MPLGEHFLKREEINYRERRKEAITYKATKLGVVFVRCLAFWLGNAPAF